MFHPQIFSTMKRFLTILLAVIGVTVTVFLTGCSSDTDDIVAPANEPIVETPVDDAFLPADEAFIAKYQALNDSLAKAWEADPANALPADTRASVFWSKLKIVVKADLVGAAREAIATSTKKLTLFQRIANIFLRAVSHSITVGINESVKKKVPGGPQVFEGAANCYAELQLDPTVLANKMEFWDNKTGLVLPTKYQDRNLAGRYHNLILDMDAPNVYFQLESVFEADHLEYLLSSEFQNAFYSPQYYYDGITTLSPSTFYTSSMRTKEEAVILAFLDTISNDTYQMMNINQVVLAYLNQVDKETFSDDSKQLVQQSFVLGSYSYTYWKDKITF